MQHFTVLVQDLKDELQEAKENAGDSAEEKRLRGGLFCVVFLMM
jgi:hypothetical protein